MVNANLLKALEAALIEYQVDGNVVHTPFCVIYDMADPFNRQSERYELEDGGVLTSAASVVNMLETWYKED